MASSLASSWMESDDYEKQFDTDTISTTSTAATAVEADALYEVECILSEESEGADRTSYLIKWLGYPMHRCTWEPIEHLIDTGPELLRTWKETRKALGEDGFKEYCRENVDLFEQAGRNARANKVLIQEKRAKKRRKQRLKQLAEKNHCAVVERDIDDDGPLLNAKTSRPVQESASAAVSERRQTKDSTSLSVTEKGTTKPPRRKSPIEQSPTSEESDATEDSLVKELKNKGRKRLQVQRQKQEHSLGQAVTEEGIQKRTCSSIAKVPALQKEKEPQVQQQQQQSKTIASTSKAPLKTTGTVPVGSKSRRDDPEDENPAEASTASGKRLAPPRAASSVAATNTAAAPIALMKRTVTPGQTSTRIKMVNQPKAPSRKTWSNSDKAFTTLHYRYLADKRSRTEATPDPAALEFVSLRSNKNHVDLPSNDNPYSRREAGRRRVQETERTDISDEPPQSTSELRSYEIGKVPLCCFEWRNGSCRYNAQDCRFLHRYNDPKGRPYQFSPLDGSVPPKYAYNPVTCWYWLRGDKGCSKPADECKFAHENTGLLANGLGHGQEVIDCNETPRTDKTSAWPPTKPPAWKRNSQVTCWFWLRGPSGCSKPAEACKYAHYNTGLINSTAGRPPEPIDRSEVPAHVQVAATPRPSSPVLRIRQGSKQKLPPHQVTCYFWAQGACKHADWECKYAHHDTGVVADTRGLFKASDRSISTQCEPPDRGVLFSADDIPLPVSEGANPNESARDAHESHNLAKPVQPPNRRSVSPTRSEVRPASPPSSFYFEHKIEEACHLDFQEIFTYEDGNGPAVVDRRAFLLFHPESHVEETELLTRWLLLNHVEVLNFWIDGAWDNFTQSIVAGGSGVIFVHPDVERFSDIPEFGAVLGSKVRVWSIGLQAPVHYDLGISLEEPVLQYHRIEIFPLGGFIYVADDVFEKKPMEALKIVKLFFDKIEKCRQVTGPVDPYRRVKDGFLPWRLAVRPELMQSIWDICVQHRKAVRARDPYYMSLIELYTLLDRTGYIQHHEHCSSDMPNDIPEDYYPIISERGETWNDLYFEARKRSLEEADRNLVCYFSGMVQSLCRDYRHFFVVHTDPQKVMKWKEAFSNIEEIMTPERCIWYFEQKAKGNRFDFFEWAYPEKDRVDAGA